VLATVAIIQRAYRVLVNARTGEVQGERPWSWVKIALLALLIAAIIGAGVFFGNGGTLNDLEMHFQ
jgi:hypothetical protein